jgi:hypothetical protein
MTALMIALRIIHIFSAIFWVGTSLFFLFFFEPALRAAGAAGGAVMSRLIQTPYPAAIASAAGLTVLAGLTMYGIDSHGVQGSWIIQTQGIVLSIGALAGLGAFAVGMFGQFPITKRLSTLSKEIQAAGGQPTPGQQEELRRLQAQLVRWARWAVILMIIAVLGMASAREFGQI